MENPLDPMEEEDATMGTEGEDCNDLDAEIHGFGRY
jgi:hypothetical protein